MVTLIPFLANRMEEKNIEKLEWMIFEYEQKEHSVDWYWTISIITLVSIGLAIWAHNYLFAVFILISCFSLILINVRAPNEITFVIDNDGIIMGKEVHPWKSLKGFHVTKGVHYDKLLIETNKKFLPIYRINLPKDLTPKIKRDLLIFIPNNSDLKESRSMQLMEKLGF